MRAAEAQIRLCIVWSEPSLSAYARKHIIGCRDQCGIFMTLKKKDGNEMYLNSWLIVSVV